MIEPQPFETSRFRYRPVVQADLDAFFPTFADAAQMKYWSRGPFRTKDEFAEWLFAPVNRARIWAVDDRETGLPVARISVIQVRPGVSEIGYTVMMEHQRKGIGAACVAGLIDRLIHVEGQHRIAADTDPENDASNALLRKLGFTVEGRLREEWKTHIGLRDALVWGLLAREWNVSPQGR